MNLSSFAIPIKYHIGIQHEMDLMKTPGEVI
jgi:hypothetical protein